jgi:hypothetical protein
MDLQTSKIKAQNWPLQSREQALILVKTPFPTVADKIRGRKIFAPMYTFNFYVQATYKAFNATVDLT